MLLVVSSVTRFFHFSCLFDSQHLLFCPYILSAPSPLHQTIADSLLLTRTSLHSSPPCGQYGSLVHWFIGSLVHWFIGSSVHRFIGSSVHRFIGSSVHRFIGSSVHPACYLCARGFLASFRPTPTYLPALPFSPACIPLHGSWPLLASSACSA